jgi:hypothetical protein
VPWKEGGCNGKTGVAKKEQTWKKLADEIKKQGSQLQEMQEQSELKLVAWSLSIRMLMTLSLILVKV